MNGEVLKNERRETGTTFRNKKGISERQMLETNSTNKNIIQLQRGLSIWK
jgi:hypothetical protein